MSRRNKFEAEQAGFEFSTISDHFHPWVEAQGHAGYMWSMLGAISQTTKTLPLLPYVTAPIIRYHPAVVAQKAATSIIQSQSLNWSATTSGPDAPTKETASA